MSDLVDGLESDSEDVVRCLTNACAERQAGRRCLQVPGQVPEPIQVPGWALRRPSRDEHRGVGRLRRWVS
eukprot:2930074-Rhodomonas_salina.1